MIAAPCFTLSSSAKQKLNIQTLLELIQPLDGEWPHGEFLEQKGEGIQHLGFLVDNLEEGVKGLTDKGSDILLKSQRQDGGVAYLDLDAAGLIVELVQHNHK